MKTGIVVGKVWATKRVAELPNGALLEIAIEEEDDMGDRVVAFDPLGAGVGERVLITEGSVARAWFKDGNNVIDALVIGILDEQAPVKTAKKS
jgi:ethanolamine utilization protein EutN